MGKKQKTGKHRKDKYYHIAKEIGYRSRAAFKLIQLNRKFEFLQRAKVCIDLCASPGGWMQVAKNTMPVNNVIIGVDLVDIPSIPQCISIKGDITTDKCRADLRKTLPAPWKYADVVLNDGAPNMGKNWLHDAYTQNCLTLSALKIATEFLKENGWFVTKVFRSKDYNCLLWTFKQLFHKVHVTKPPASRNESAEIFVVCEKYKKPNQIDPRLFIPNYVFKELDVEAPITIQTLFKNLTSDKKKKADGYSDDMTYYQKLPASHYISSDTPAIILQNAYEIVIDDDKILNHAKTTDEIKRCCADIKVLGKTEIRSLLSWWKALRAEKKEITSSKEDEPQEKGGKSNESEEKSEKVGDGKEVEDETYQQIVKELAELEEEFKREVKRKKKKANRVRAKELTRILLGMQQKGDSGPTFTNEYEMFRLDRITSNKKLTKICNQNPDIMAEESDDEMPRKKVKKIRYNVDSQLDANGLYYKNGSDDESEEDDVNRKADEDIYNDMEVDDDDEPKKKRVRFNLPEENTELEFEPEDDDASHPLLTDLDSRGIKDKKLAKAQLWFDKDIFKDIEAEDDEDYELDRMAEEIIKKGAKVVGVSDEQFDDGINDKENDGCDDDNDDDDDEMNNNTKAAPIKEPSIVAINEWDVDDVSTNADKKRRKKEKRTLDAEGLALATLMVNSSKSRRDIIDNAYNRYTYNDECLPEWFRLDEEKHNKKELAVPQELVEEYKKSREEINVRPLKKVIEAKARKKRRNTRRLEKLKKKLENVMDNPDMTEPEKAKQAKAMYRKVRQPKIEVKYVVAKKYTAGKRAVRPPGLKGPYKVVDGRMKKDVRGKMRAEAKNKSKKSKGNKWKA